MQIAEALGSLDRFMFSVGNKDKVFAVAQFLPMALAGPAAKFGYPSLGESLANLSKMADATRAVGRLTLLANALADDKLLARPTANPLEILQHVFHCFFCVFENCAVYGSHGVLPKCFSQLGGSAVTCWFYVLLLDIGLVARQLTASKLTEKEEKATKIRLLKDLFYIVFSLSCIPAGGITVKGPPGLPLDLLNLLQFIAPPHIPMDNTIRGLLGFGATICEFYFADSVDN